MNNNFKCIWFLKCSVLTACLDNVWELKLTSSCSSDSFSVWLVTYLAISFSISDDVSRSPDRKSSLSLVMFSNSVRIIVTILYSLSPEYRLAVWKNFAFWKKKKCNYEISSNNNILHLLSLVWIFDLVQ